MVSKIAILNLVKRILLVIILAFGLGFLTHALFFPDLLSNGIIFKPELLISNDPIKNFEKPEAAEYVVEYRDGKFSRSNITVPVGRYFILINKSPDTLMNVVSTLKPLSTPRPYGLEEQIRLRLDSKGQFYIQEKENRNNQLVITVK